MIYFGAEGLEADGIVRLYGLLSCYAGLVLMS